MTGSPTVPGPPPRPAVTHLVVELPDEPALLPADRLLLEAYAYRSALDAADDIPSRSLQQFLS